MSFFIKGHPMIRALIFPLPRFHFQEDRKMEHEIVHISMYLFYFLLNAKKHFRGLNSLQGRSLLDVSDYNYDAHNFSFVNSIWKLITQIDAVFYALQNDIVMVFFLTFSLRLCKVKQVRQMRFSYDIDTFVECYSI